MQAPLHPTEPKLFTLPIRPGLSRTFVSWHQARMDVLGMVCQNAMLPGHQRGRQQRLLGASCLTEHNQDFTSKAMQLPMAALRQKTRLRQSICATGASSRGSWILHHRLHRLRPVVSCHLLRRTLFSWTGMNTTLSGQHILLRHGTIRRGRRRWLKGTHSRRRWEAWDLDQAICTNLLRRNT